MTDLLLTSNPAEVYNPYFINLPNDEIAFRECLLSYQDSSNFNRDWRKHSIRHLFFNRIQNAEDIQNGLEQIYKDSISSFKFSIYFYSIWEELEIDEDNKISFRYFSSSTTHNLNVFPFIPPDRTEPEEKMHYIANKSELEHYKAQLDDDRIQDFMRGGTTKTKPICIYKIEFKIVDRNVPLGGSKELPDFILKTKKIIDLKDVDDGMYFWAAMSLASGCNPKWWKRKASELKKEWDSYTQRSYSGMKLDDIYEYEHNVNKDYAINLINLRSIKDNKWIYDPILVSDFNHERPKVYLNIYMNHISYITDFESQVNKFNCNKCGHVFADTKDLTRHLKTCGLQKVVTFPSPENCIFRKPDNRIYTLCQEYGTSVFNDVKLRLHKNSDILIEKIESLYRYDYVITFDFESMFAINEQTQAMQKISGLSRGC